jgi:capsular exopolysaccharide synthesis family protein
MSRVYRALERAEKEKESKSKEGLPSKVSRADVTLNLKNGSSKHAVERLSKNGAPPEEERVPLVAPPDSFAAEQFRKLKTQIFHWSPTPPRIILVTSTVPQEGKTIVSVNLAMAISQEIQKKVVLIDGDLRKPSIHLRSNKDAKGLYHYLLDQVSLPDILVDVEGQNLRFVPAGDATRKSAELIGSRRMGELVRSMRELGEETYTIIDSPPIASTSDPVLLSKMVDGVIVVVMADRTPKESIRRAIASIDRDKIIGIVLNQVDIKPSSYYSQYYYGYNGKKGYYGK